MPSTRHHPFILNSHHFLLLFPVQSYQSLRNCCRGEGACVWIKIWMQSALGQPSPDSAKISDNYLILRGLPGNTSCNAQYWGKEQQFCGAPRAIPRMMHITGGRKNCDFGMGRGGQYCTQYSTGGGGTHKRCVIFGTPLPTPKMMHSSGGQKKLWILVRVSGNVQHSTKQQKSGMILWGTSGNMQYRGDGGERDDFGGGGDWSPLAMMHITGGGGTHTTGGTRTPNTEPRPPAARTEGATMTPVTSRRTRSGKSAKSQIPSAELPLGSTARFPPPQAAPSLRRHALRGECAGQRRGCGARARESARPAAAAAALRAAGARLRGAGRAAASPRRRAALPPLSLSLAPL